LTSSISSPGTSSWSSSWWRTWQRNVHQPQRQLVQLGRGQQLAQQHGVVDVFLVQALPAADEPRALRHIRAVDARFCAGQNAALRVGDADPGVEGIDGFLGQEQGLLVLRRPLRVAQALKAGNEAQLGGARVHVLVELRGHAGDQDALQPELVGFDLLPHQVRGEQHIAHRAGHGQATDEQHQLQPKTVAQTRRHVDAVRAEAPPR
jgi:hypothetical protein